MLSAQELSSQIAQTSAFIDADPSSVVLRGITSTPDGKGGLKRTWPLSGYRDAQTLRLIPRSSQNDVVKEVMTAEGVIATVEFVLLGLPSSTIVQHDRFSWNGELWEVAQIHRSASQYETKGDVVKVG